MLLEKLSAKNPIVIMAASFIATAAVLSIAAPAQVIRGHDSRAPVDVSAGQLELQDKADRVIGSGGVTVTQAGLTIKSSRLTATYTRAGTTELNRIDAVGNVIITQGDLRATSNAAIYDMDTDLITLIGNVALNQGSNRLNGGRLVIDLNAGRTVITGNNAPASGAGAASEGNGRVSARFTVPQRKSDPSK
jgi:lipopolysaccharide export system protein LptA